MISLAKSDGYRFGLDPLNGSISRPPLETAPSNSTLECCNSSPTTGGIENSTGGYSPPQRNEAGEELTQTDEHIYTPSVATRGELWFKSSRARSSAHTTLTQPHDRAAVLAQSQEKANAFYASVELTSRSPAPGESKCAWVHCWGTRLCPPCSPGADPVLHRPPRLPCPPGPVRPKTPCPHHGGCPIPPP